MKPRSEARKIVTPENFDVFYWVNWSKGMNKEFVVLHPSSGANHTGMERLEKLISDYGHPTIVMDQRGYGYSMEAAQKATYTLAQRSDDLQKMIKQEGIEKPTYLGSSLGFLVVADCAAKLQNAGQIIGLSATADFEKSSPSKIIFAYNESALNKLLWENGGSAVMQLWHYIKGEKRGYQDLAALEHKSDVAVYFVMADKKPLSISQGREIDHAKLPDEEIASIKAPVHLIYGKSDFLVRPKAAEHLKGLLQNCTIEIMPGQHSLPITRPREVFEVIRKYL
jgi:pimeloyl-ACP methyl ester carboxylesterase